MEKYYQEKEYLSGNKEALKKIEEFKNYIQEKKEKEKKRYSDTIEMYHIFTDEVASFLKSLDLHSSLEYSLAITYLIHKGYLSVNKSYESVETEEELSYTYGVSITTGKGCCRNQTTFHKEVMNGLGIYTDRLYCAYDSILKSGTNKEAEHMISLIRYQKTIYGFDVAHNGRLYRFTSPFELKQISLTEGKKLFYKPYMEIGLDNSTLEIIKKNIKRYSREAEKKWINPMKYEDEIKYGVFQYMKEQEKELESFHEKTKSLKKEIVSSLKSKKKEEEEDDDI